MAPRYIDPLSDPGELLLTVAKPARYVGGEYGLLAKRDVAAQDTLALEPSQLRMLIAFPDLYEIGMCNQAFRIIYNRLNSIPGISCDRAFAPAPDFEELLRVRNISLYGLDTGIALGDLDILMFTLGYELGITGVLTMLDRGYIPLKRTERGKWDPIVIMGGPCVSNPLPYERFIDAFWIGEAEAGFFDLAAKLRDLKQAGEGRAELLTLLHSHPSVWTSGKPKAVRAMDRDFSSRQPMAAVFPIPSMKTVQQHGAVEIMRGCPNGCRFCHAGIWYRPMRQKSADTIREEVSAFIKTGGYREISLSSLSSGDYQHIGDLIENLNNEYSAEHISFQLPSLRVSSFSLPLLEKVSAVRKSGLTFAVETPADAWQMSINKEVSRDNVAAILLEAKRNGWRGAKFYFMVGLPVGDYQQGYEHNREEEEIAGFILDLARRTGMHFNVNVGTFIPKPHTPYQWVPQIDEKTAREKIEYIRNKLKPMGHKVGVNDPFIAVIEGVLSRGDERVGELIETAYARGCRLDAWDEYIKKDLWAELLEANASLTDRCIGARDPEIPLPWDCIQSGSSTGFLKREFERSNAEEFTSLCIDNCNNKCGICDKRTSIVYNNIHGDNLLYDKKPILEINPLVKRQDSDTWRIVFTFTKQDRTLFLSHLSVIEVFSMALMRAGVPVLFSQGFNPLPLIDFASPLSLGITGEAEIATLDTATFLEGSSFMEKLNPQLPQGMAVTGSLNIHILRGAKKHSAASLLWGYSYRTGDGEPDYVPAREEKQYRLSRTGAGSIYGLARQSVLAKDQNTGGWMEYFTAYRGIYGAGD
jgi:radical SAM superfamily enzyme YgiQ (UPF0313 family)